MAKKTKAKAKTKAKKSKAPARKKKALPVPKGYHNAHAVLALADAKAALAWYVKAFGAKPVSLMEGPDGKVMHAEMRIGDTIIMFNDEMQMGPGSPKSPKSLGGVSGSVMMYTKDVDSMYKRAMGAGAVSRMPPADQFWGDRFGQVEDPFGHVWSMGTRLQDLTQKQMRKAAEGFFAQMAKSSS